MGFSLKLFRDFIFLKVMAVPPPLSGLAPRQDNAYIATQNAQSNPNVSISPLRHWARAASISSMPQSSKALFPGGSGLFERLDLVLDQSGVSSSELAWAARAFDTDHHNGHARNCCTKDTLDSIGIDLSLKSLMIKRKHIMIVKAPVHLFEFPEVLFLQAASPGFYEEDITLQVFDFIQDRFVSIGDLAIETIENQLSTFDIIVQFNRVIHRPMLTYFGKSTLKSVEGPKLFYHERQVEFYCGIHAMNAFIGEETIDVVELQNYTIEYYEKKGVFPGFGKMEPYHFDPFDEDYFDFKILDISFGINLDVLADYIRQKQRKGLLPEKYRYLKTCRIKRVAPKSSEEEYAYYRSENGIKWRKINKDFFDRRERIFIAKSNPDHCVTLRKILHSDEWRVVDSELSTQDIVDPMYYLDECHFDLEDPDNGELRILYFSTKAIKDSSSEKSPMLSGVGRSQKLQGKLAEKKSMARRCDAAPELG